MSETPKPEVVTPARFKSGLWKVWTSKPRHEEDTQTKESY